MGEETNAYDPAGSQFDDDVTAERPTDRAAHPATGVCKSHLGV